MFRGVLLLDEEEAKTVSETIKPPTASIVKKGEEGARDESKPNLFKQNSRDAMNYNPLDPGVIVESSKVNYKYLFQARISLMEL